ncbi:MAG: hypothetical protein LBU67_10415 [Oscillospiraceae bacterium]|jgi:tetratricopeptide (TPR) repeat protein|nr:hypothetical protein [Oscillospiraceae bacterium]
MHSNMAQEDYATMGPEEILQKKHARFTNLKHYRRDNELHWLGNARLHEETGDLTEAVKLCSIGLTRNPFSGVLYTERGRLSLLLGEFEEAAADLVRALVFDEGEWRARFHCGIAHCLLGAYAQAEACLTQSLEEAQPGAALASACWLWLTLLKAGKAAAAERFIAAYEMPAGAIPEIAHGWQKAVLLAKGRLRRETLAADPIGCEASAAQAFAVYAHARYLDRDERAAATALARLRGAGGARPTLAGQAARLEPQA